MGVKIQIKERIQSKIGEDLYGNDDL
jgi:hypothetical protein